MIKKLFTIDDFVVAFISSLGYGYGETISRLSGWPKAACTAASFVLGIAAEELISRIVFSPSVQKKKEDKFITYALFVLLFLAAHAVSVRWMGVSMVDYLVDEFQSVVLFPLLGFGFNILLRGYRILKIRRLYGEETDSYVFDVDDEDRQEINLRNRPISGDYGDRPAVKTRTGIFVGEEENKSRVYRGIPYAKPPIGPLRWKAPEPLPSSDAVYEAVHFGPSAIQVEHKGAILAHHRQSEDCLYLNIWVSPKNREEKKPVLVLFHYGDFSFGGSADPLLYGDDFAEDHSDVVVVSFNWRLGIFGFIDFSEVPGGEAYPDTRNLGLLDQIAALQWIKENIAAFGGDPDRITVMGFESGASSICLLAASPRAKGLFQKAFVFFGSPEGAYETTDTSRALAEDLLKETKTSTMAELAALSPKALKDASQKLWQDLCAPTCDGTWIPEDVYLAYQNGAASGIEFILAIPRNELPVFRSFIGTERYEEFLFSPENDVPGRTGTSDTLEAREKRFEQRNAYYMYQTAVKLSEGGNEVHLLFWDTEPLLEQLGSGTVDAAAVLLGNADALQLYGSVMNNDLSEVLQTLLEKYIKGSALHLYTNEIKGVSALDWKAYPKALIVSDGKLSCGPIKDRITGGIS